METYLSVFSDHADALQMMRGFESLKELLLCLLYRRHAWVFWAVLDILRTLVDRGCKLAANDTNVHKQRYLLTLTGTRREMSRQVNGLRKKFKTSLLT